MMKNTDFLMISVDMMHKDCRTIHAQVEIVIFSQEQYHLSEFRKARKYLDEKNLVMVLVDMMHRDCQAFLGGDSSRPPKML